MSRLLYQYAAPPRTVVALYGHVWVRNDRIVVRDNQPGVCYKSSTDVQPLGTVLLRDDDASPGRSLLYLHPGSFIALEPT